MNPELLNELRKLRNEIAHGTAPVAPIAVAERLNSLGITVPSDQLPVLIPTILQTFGGPHVDHLHVPPVLSDALPKLLAGRSPQTLCDPWAGVGTLLAIAQRAVSVSRCYAFNMNASEGMLAKALFPTAEWMIGKPLELLEKLANPIDIVVSCLPFGGRASEMLLLSDMAGNPLELKDDLGNLILAASTARLSENGLGLFVVPLSFFFSKRSVLRRFADLGFNVDAALALPSGSFAPYTAITTYLLVITKSSTKPMFVAQLSGDANTNSHILSNLANGKEGGAVELGRYVEALDFRGIDSLRASDYFETASKQIGFPAILLEDLATTINLGRFGEGFKFPIAPNAIFVPMIGQSDVVDSIDELTMKAQNYAQVVVDPAKSHASFIAQFLNSELGKKIREWGKSGTTIPKLNKQTLKSLQVFIPDLTTQQKMLEIEARLSAEENTLFSLQNDLQELRRELWRNPRFADTVSERLTEFTARITGELKEQASIGLDQWFETIPFPIASILRAWQATPSDDYKTKHEHLLHFFEATAEFLSVILLSAFSRNEALYALHKQKLKESMGKQNLSFRRGTFGTWKLVVEYLGKQTRLLLQEHGKKPDDAKNDRAICASIFADSGLKLPSLLSSKGIAAILGATNKMRNDWSGHGGVVGQDEAKLRNAQLLAQVEKLRQAMSDVWDSAVVVNAIHCRPRRGVFENEIAMLRGSNSEFLKESRSMTTWLDVDSLYIVNGDQSGALKLLPLIQVNASPGTSKNACYFFNRTEREGARFVSYHFVGKPELSGQFQEATDAIRFLSED
ncbi:MAG: restriction endonuclease subunit S [Verrucomicrobiota bacterium]